MKIKNRTIRPLGTLEEKVMNILWRAGPFSVREVNQRLGEKSLAHTTVMTTLDRLFKKRLLFRTKEGNAYIYRYALSRDEYQQQLVASTVSGLMSKAANASPVLAGFIDAAVEIDEENLTKLEALIAERRRSGG